MAAEQNFSADTDDPCPICLNQFTFPVELKCKHRLCYLCFKGVALMNEKCPMCRKKIGKRFLNKPKFVKENVGVNLESNEGELKWFYEGANGWWLYDNVTNDYIENAFRDEQTDCRICVAGNCYTISFNDMMQYRVDTPSKKRRIKRDVYKPEDGEFKGLAGISKSQLESIANKRSSIANTSTVKRRRHQK